MKPTKKPRAVKALVDYDGHGPVVDCEGFDVGEPVYVVNAAWMREHRAMVRGLTRLQSSCKHYERDDGTGCAFCGAKLPKVEPVDPFEAELRAACDIAKLLKREHGK